MTKVAVLGAGGGVGQALSLLLRLSPLVDQLALYDRSKARGVAVDLSHIPAKQVVNGYNTSDDGLTKSLSGADIVIVVAGPAVLSGPSFSSRNDLLQHNASVVGPLLERCGTICPKALIMIVTNPINSIVPFAAEILKRHNSFDPRRLFGITTLDVVRAETFLADMLRTTLNTELDVAVDVIGGHSADTIVPLFSRVDAIRELSFDQVDGLMYHTIHGGAEVFLLKDKKGAATLSTAYATFRFAERACRALNCENGLRECSFVYLPGLKGGKGIIEKTGIDFFSAPVKLGAYGAHRVIDPLQWPSDKEKPLLEKAVKELKVEIQLGTELGKTFQSNAEGE